MKQNKIFSRALALTLATGAFAIVSSTMPHANAEETESLSVEALDADRYQMKREGETIIRLDKKTGAMSTCLMKGSSLVCRLAANERDALEKEIAALQLRLEETTNADSKEKSSKLERNSDQSEDDSESLARKEEDKKLDQELDRMVDLSSKVLRRFFSVMKELKEDLARE